LGKVSGRKKNAGYINALTNMLHFGDIATLSRPKLPAMVVLRGVWAAERRIS
jgi:hypothetical protein